MAVTTQDVLNAINELKANNQKVTQASVLAITKGSASTINKIFKELKANTSANNAAMPQTITLPSNVISALGDFVDVEIAKAKQSLTDDISELEKVNDAITKEAEDLNIKVNDLEPQITKLQNDLTAANTTIQIQADQLKAAQEQAAAKDLVAENTRNELATARVGLTAAEKTIADLEAKIKAAEQQVIDAVKDKNSANEARIAAEKATAIAEVKAQNAQDNAKKLEAREAALKKQFDDLSKNHLDSINKSNIALQSVNAELVKAVSESRQLETKNAELQKQLAELTAAKKAAEPTKKAG